MELLQHFQTIFYYLVRSCKMKYYVIKRELSTYVFKEENNLTVSIPDNVENTDYQAYLAWVAEGNEAEEVEQ